jgi:hypothetical protein
VVFEQSVGTVAHAHPVDGLRRGVNQIVELSTWKYCHLVQILAGPLYFFGQIYKAIFDGTGDGARRMTLSRELQ